MSTSTTQKATRQAWPAETRARALELLRAGEGSTAASRATGVPVPTITRWARAEGIDLPGATRAAVEGARTTVARRRLAAEVTVVERLEAILDGALSTLAIRSELEETAHQLLRDRPGVEWHYPEKGGPVPMPADPEARDALARLRMLEETTATRDLVGKATRVVHDLNLLRGDATARGDVVVHFGIPRPYEGPPRPVIDLGAQ